MERTKYFQRRSLNVRLHLRHKRSNSRVRLFVCLSVVSVKGVRSMGGRCAILHANLKGREMEGGEGKNSGSTNKCAKFGQLIVRKIIKILPPDVTAYG